MNKKLMMLLLILLISLSGCDNTTTEDNYNVDLTPIDLISEDCLVDLDSLVYNNKNILMDDQGDIVKLNTLVTEICNKIDNTNGNSIGASRPSYNYWGFKITSGDITIGITFYSTDTENTNHHMIVTYTENEEIIKTLTYYYNTDILDDLIILLETK